MTDALCAEQEQSEQPSEPTTKIKLELFDQGAVTLWWDEIEAAMDAIAHGDIRARVTYAQQIRKGTLLCVGVWLDGRLTGLAVTRRVRNGITDESALAIEALYGRGLSDEQWLEACQRLIDVARAAGFDAIIGTSQVPRVNEIAKACEFDEYTLYRKDL